MELVRRVSEGLARKTSRRGLFGRGAEVASGALFGTAASTLTRPGVLRLTPILTRSRIAPSPARPAPARPAQRAAPALSPVS